ncbi:MAG: type II toxin-antitoxin system HicA family toxin [Thermoplasmatota archaeon]
MKLRSAGGITTIVPNHPGRDVKVGLLHSILATAEITIEEFQREI